MFFNPRLRQGFLYVAISIVVLIVLVLWGMLCSSTLRSTLECQADGTPYPGIPENQRIEGASE